ncbi:ralA-binding protein 1 [Apis dorsata]|uniref:ralA-binding protein 1 n=1 Tax=Apis dorsata TaxID=7462 RepID=UPI0012940154|nr:ralA-binding protein 1 [Apis dorsata]
MDFESPDVEKEFPGLYASESAKKSNESDFSDEGGHEKHSKKELLGGKRKEKKDRKDRGYATLEGESSPDEDQETKSPSKSKKTKAFKFPSKKEKHRKKGKHNAEDGLDIGEGQPVFGVSLHLAVERSRCHDGIDLPLVVRDCIDFIEEHGMNIEGLYKVPGVKSKVQHLKKELPEPVLESSEMISRFEQAASTKDVAQREAQLLHLTQQLPKCNNVLLAWIILHLDHVTIREKTTKMNAQTISMTLSPVLQMSHRLLLALLFHCKALFPNVKLTKYVPPLSSGSINLPDSVESIAAELSKQESLLSQIHMQMNAGFVTKLREEQLWEVQRMITQLKRKYKTVQKMEGAQKSLDEEVKSNDEIAVELNIQKTKTEEEDIDYAKPETQSISTLTLKKDSKAHILEDNKESTNITNINIIQNERNAHDKDIVDSTEISTIIPQFNEQENISSFQQ